MTPRGSVPTAAAPPTAAPPGAPAAVPVEQRDPALLADAAETFAMLASPTRLHLLCLLADGGKDVTTLATEVGMTVAAVSQHLAKLRLADLVSARRQGKHQIYAMDDPHIVTLVQQVLEHHADLRARSGRQNG